MYVGCPFGKSGPYTRVECVDVRVFVIVLFQGLGMYGAFGLYSGHIGPRAAQENVHQSQVAELYQTFYGLFEGNSCER